MPDPYDKPDMSFLPEEYVERRAERRTNFIMITLFVVVMGSIFAAFVVTDRQRSEVKRMQQVVDAQFEEAAKRLEQLDKLQAQSEQMLRKGEMTNKIRERIPRSNLLAELINNMPPTLSLLELNLETKAVRNQPKPTTAMQAARQKGASKAPAVAKVEEPEIAATDIKLDLVGVASTDVQVAGFMTALENSAMFKDMNLVYSEEIRIEDQRLRKFRLEVHLNQNVDLTQFRPLMVRRELPHNPMNAGVGFDAAGALIKRLDPAGLIPVGDRKPAHKE
jgi:Tfp pilus assembly protein PilN